MPTSPRARGFTLLELLVGAAVGAVVLVGISLTFISQAQQYQAHASRRALQSNARQSLSFVERHLRVAGYGVDPDRAIIAYDSYDAATDSQGQGYPDALVVHWRDPIFSRNVIAADPTSITLDRNLAANEVLRMGQILLVICSPNHSPTSISDLIANSLPPHAFVTVGKYADSSNPRIDLDPAVPAAAPNSPIRGPGRLFHEQAALGNAGDCFHSATSPPVVVMVHRAAFYLAMFNMGGTPTPYLMMHQGLDMPTATQIGGNGTIDANDAVPVAEGIEQLQAAYILDTNDQDLDKTPLVLGVDSIMDATHYGENWEQIDPNLPTGWAFNPFTLYPSKLFPPSYPPPTDPTVLTLVRAHLRDHPANIRQVRVTMVARSTVPDPQITGDDMLKQPNGTDYPFGPKLANGTYAWRQLENLDQAGPVAAAFKPSAGHYYRTIVRQSIAPKNMLMNRQFVPVTPGGG